MITKKGVWTTLSSSHIKVWYYFVRTIHGEYCNVFTYSVQDCKIKRFASKFYNVFTDNNERITTGLPSIEGRCKRLGIYDISDKNPQSNYNGLPVSHLVDILRFPSMTADFIRFPPMMATKVNVHIKVPIQYRRRDILMYLVQQYRSIINPY